MMSRISPEKVEWNPIKYTFEILNGGLLMKLGHLWFLPVLLIVVVMNYPLLAFSRRRGRQLEVDFEDFKFY